VRMIFHFVIAGLDPAIHAEPPLGKVRRSAFVCQASAWTTGSSPVVTKENGPRERDSFFSSPRVRGEVDLQAERRKSGGGHCRDSEPCGQAPLPQPSPRKRGEGGVSRTP